MLEPLLTVATRVFAPELKAEDKIFFVFAAPPATALPFKTHVVVQLESPGVTVNALLVSAAAAIFGVAEAGTTLAIVHAGKMLIAHEHCAESKPSLIVATTVPFPK